MLLVRSWGVYFEADDWFVVGHEQPDYSAGPAGSGGTPTAARQGRRGTIDRMATGYGRVNAPEFPADADWLNTARPLRLADFSGKLLLLDFWTYCCINCMHLLPTLRRLEREFPEELAVVGVHSAKYDQERATENVRQAVMRYGIRHPVLNDSSMETWRQYAVRAWPTLMFVDPAGRVVGKVEGELGLQQGMELVRRMLDLFRAEGSLRPGPLVHEAESPRSDVLRYPGKVLADPVAERLFIADSGHHRVLVTDTDGQIQTVIGSGEEGFADGVPEGARFSNPQGMALSGEVLYIADTGNHAIRAVDLDLAVVDTAAGTGERGAGRVDGGPGPTVPLRSPWDLVRVGMRLFIAMAGSHQLWMYDLESGLVQAVAGTGGEGIVDGLPEDALLAQPSGIAADEDGVLFFADSETSAVRPGRPHLCVPGHDAGGRRTVRFRRRGRRSLIGADAAPPRPRGRRGSRLRGRYV